MDFTYANAMRLNKKIFNTVRDDWIRIIQDVPLDERIRDSFVLAFLFYEYEKHLEDRLIMYLITGFLDCLYKRIQDNPKKPHILTAARQMCFYLKRDENSLKHLHVISNQIMPQLATADRLYAQIPSTVPHKLPGPDYWLDSCHVFCDLWEKHPQLLVSSKNKHCRLYAEHMMTMCPLQLRAKMPEFKKEKRGMGFLYAVYECSTTSS